MNWKNIDLKSGYERDQPLIDSLSSDTLLLEIQHNCREITKEAIMQQFETDLQSRVDSAREIMTSNLDNFLKQAKRER
jgi:hypothetical protein